MKILILLDLNLSCLLPMLLFMLGAFLLGWLLKHLFGREKRELAELHITHDELNSKHNAYVSDSTTKYNSLDGRYSSLQSDYNIAAENGEKLKKAELEIGQLKASLDIAAKKPANEKIVEVPAMGLAAETIATSTTEGDNYTRFYKAISAFFGAKIVKDDLKLVEGIGPVIEKVLNEADYNTWASVAGADAATLKSILDGAGDQFAMHDPGTWPKQCQLMVDDKWSELKKYQDELDAGKMI